MKRNEIYIGSPEEVAIIERELIRTRQEVPSRFNKHMFLKDAKAANSHGVDWALFDRIIVQAEAHFKSIDPKFCLMPLDRYIIMRPNEGSNGGFYGRPVGGYYYKNDLAFGTVLNEKVVPNMALRTIELARNYLHDSIHSCTFKSFRMDELGINIYRYQYWINFRNFDGKSYSAPDLHKSNPDSINVNTWMDALVHMQASDFLQKNFSGEIDTSALNELEKELWREVSEMKFDPMKLPDAIKFYEDTITPTAKFLDKWGKHALFDETLKAMLTGDLQPLKDYFNQTLMRPDAWEMMFKQAAYVDLETRTTQDNTPKDKPHNNLKNNNKK